MAAVAVVIGLVGALWPRLLAYPVAFVALWSGLAWLAKGISLRRGRRSGPRIEQLEDAMAGSGDSPAEAPRGTEGVVPGKDAAPDKEGSAARDRIT